jgi:hypothetical protein
MEEKVREALLRLANAADAVGVKFFDGDDSRATDCKVYEASRRSSIASAALTSCGSISLAASS